MDMNTKENGSTIVQKIGKTAFIQRLWNALKEGNAHTKYLIGIKSFHKFFRCVSNVVKTFVKYVLMTAMIVDQVNKEELGLIRCHVDVKKRSVKKKTREES
eukprot:TRINITY_DN7367_c0_g1_i1.p2 TRINITY_DN7367_c0_g1~~TRINITY_DN7367_c0_g1_i1.p2  ORF type:complete len:101 (+),score=18.29 TRINITY_DN7367_c0_g1_i1:106-408(+)